MNLPDTAAFAINAAGIAVSLCSLTHRAPSDAVRMVRLCEQFEGSLGVMSQIAAAGALMERYRFAHGPSAAWGGELPYLYDVWDAIAGALCEKLDGEPVDRLVLQAIDTLMEAS